MAQTTLPDIQIPQDVERFCVSHGILADLPLAIRLAEETFPAIRSWRFSVATDPETDEESVEIDIYVATTVEQAVESHWAFAGKWTESATKPALGQIVLIWNPI